jgi:outer membrane protein
MRNFIFIVTILVASCSVIFSNAQSRTSNTSRVWSLQECIDYAYRNNIEVRQREIGVLNREISLRQSRYNRLPDLGASANLTNNVGRSIDPFSNLVVDQDVTSHNYNASSSVNVFNGFSLINTINQNKSQLAKSEYDLQDTKNNTALNIANFYLNILLALEQVNNAMLGVESSRIQAERTEKQFNAGALPRQNLLQVLQQLANDELNLVQAENRYELSKLSLKQALQLPAETDLEIQRPQLSDPSEEALAIDLNQVFEGALGLPVVKSAQAEVESSTYGVAISRAGRYPRVTLAGGLGTNYSTAAPDIFPDPGSPTGFRDNTYKNQLDFNFRRFVQLQFIIPIFNRFQTNTNVGISKLTLDNARLNEDLIKNRLRQNVEQAFYDARAAAKTFGATKRQVSALEESYRNIEQRFNVGAVNAVEYTQTKNDFNRAQNDLIRAKYDFIFKMKVLDFYQGKPIQL